MMVFTRPRKRAASRDMEQRKGRAGECSGVEGCGAAATPMRQGCGDGAAASSDVELPLAHAWSCCPIIFPARW